MKYPCKHIVFKLFRWLFTSFICISLVACESHSTTYEPGPKPVHWLEVTPQAKQQMRLLSGVLQPADHADLSFEEPGKIATIAFEIGDLVKKGDLLAALDRRTFEITVQQHQAQMQEAEAQLVRYKADFERKERLVDSGVISKSEFDEAKATYFAAVNQVQMLKAQLSLARKNLGDTKILAPYDGRISDRYLEPHQQVEAGEAVLRIQNLDALEVALNIPETFVNQLPLHSRHRVYFSALPGLEVMGELTKLSSEATQVGSFPAKMRLLNMPESLRAGMTAEVQVALHDHVTGLDQDDKSVFILPLTAVVAGADLKNQVFCVNQKTNTVEAKPVIVDEMGSKSVTITAGLETGDIVVSKGAAFLHEGQKVRLIGKGVGIYQE